MATIATQLTALFEESARALGYEGAVPAVVATQDAAHGDYQSNFAMRLRKQLGGNPRDVAQRLIDELPSHDAVESVEIAGPGFINIRLGRDWLANEVVRRAHLEDLGTGLPGAGKTMVIDYSSPNIAKRMHVGHLRSTIIGDSIARLYRFCGWKVVADNHIGDWGTPFGMLIVAWNRWRDEDAFAEDPVAELQRLYQLFREKAADDADLLEVARAETVKLQEGEPVNRALWERFCEVSLNEFNGVYERLDVHFDVVHGESFYRDAVNPMVDDLLERGIAVHDDGAVIVPFTDQDGKGLKKNPLLIRKSDGAAMYGTTDLATVLHRMETFGPDRVIYETDVRQSLHFRQVFAASRKMGAETDFVHVGHGMLKLGGDVVSSRKGGGGALNLVDVLDLAVDHARKVVDQQSAELDESTRAAIAEAVGIAAVKYTDLSQNPASDIHFEWERMLAMEGDTAPYLMYANARCHSVFRKSGRGELADWTPTAMTLTHETERALAVMVARTPEVIIQAAEACKPNVLAVHTFQMAKAMARFWRECRILGNEDDAVTESRLTLCWATSAALTSSLGLLGIRALARM